MITDRSHHEVYKAAVRFIDAQRKMLIEAGADTILIEGISGIIRHLHKLPSSKIDQMFGKSDRDTSRASQDSAIKQAANLTLEDVEGKIESDSSVRSELEAIAIGRFHVPRGSMRSIGNIDRLRDRLRIFVQNERTHATITELALNVARDR